jgi:guanine deaminase
MTDLKTPATLVIRGGRLLDTETGAAPERDILVIDGRIATIGAPGLEAPEGTAVVDAGDCLMMPGLVNAHTHAHAALARGLVGDRATLELFLNSSASALQSRSVEDKYLSAALSAVEMIRRGVTACYDLCVELPCPSLEGLDAVARAYDDAGMRAVVAPMLADKTLYAALPGLIDALPEPTRARFAALAAAPMEASLGTCAALFRDWPFDRARIRPAIAPTIPLHCSDDFLRACGDLAREHDVPLQTHLAETKTQALLGRQKYGRSLTAHLASLGLVTPRLSAAHAIWIDDDDIAMLADGGARVAHNPMSNLRLGSGVAPVRRMLDRGLPVGIGTDGSSTSDGQNMFEATRLAAYLSRLAGPDTRAWLSAPEALRLATEGSAALLGFPTIGRIAPGYEADIVFLGLDAPHFVPLRAPLLQTVFGENGASIRRVMVGGRAIFEDGRMLTMDEAALRVQAEEAAARLDHANAGAAAGSASVASFVGVFCTGVCGDPFHARRNFECVGAG